LKVRSLRDHVQWIFLGCEPISSVSLPYPYMHAYTRPHRRSRRS
jgi:hypothetical protein